MKKDKVAKASKVVFNGKDLEVCNVCQRTLQKRNMSRHKRGHRFCGPCGKVVNSRAHACVRWNWLKLVVAPTAATVGGDQQTGVPQPDELFAYVPVLLQKTVPDMGEIPDLAFAVPNPEDLQIPPPDKPQLVIGMRKDEIENAAMAASLEEAVREAIVLEPDSSPPPQV